MKYLEEEKMCDQIGILDKAINSHRPLKFFHYFKLSGIHR